MHCGYTEGGQEGCGGCRPRGGALGAATGCLDKNVSCQIFVREREYLFVYIVFRGIRGN